MEGRKLKKIAILATGGTIAGKAPCAENIVGYKAGVFSIQDLLQEITELNNTALIVGEQICNIDSSSMTNALLLTLAKRCNELLSQDDIDGIVITHGTDTMEETAFFLNLTIRSSKPVVLVGSMRPANALSADGPLNILNAVRTAVADASIGQGVLVSMNDEIYSGRDVTKLHTMNVSTFSSPNGGALGYIVGDEVHYYYRSLKAHTINSEFYINELTDLPRVDIIYGHIGEDSVLLEASLAAGARGIVIAGCGMGGIHESIESVLLNACRCGVAVVRSSRTSSGIVTAGLEDWTKAGFINADNLNPQKARLLLQLALTRTQDFNKIQQMFAKY